MDRNQQLKRFREQEQSVGDCVSTGGRAEFSDTLGIRSRKREREGGECPCVRMKALTTR